MVNTKIQEELAIVATIDPVVQGAGTVLSDAVDMSLFESIAAILKTGVIVTNSTVDAKLVASATSGGSYTDITGKAIAQLTEAGSDGLKQVVINLRADEVPSGKRFVKLSVTVAVAACALDATILGRNARYGPGAGSDLASVDEIL